MARLPAIASTAFLFLAGNAASLSAAVTVSYSFPAAQPNFSYGDPGLTKLTDGIDLVPAWSSTVSFPDTAPFVGWSYQTATIRLAFSETVQLAGARLWFADSDDGNVGVYVPEQVVIRNDGATFFETYAVTDPAGSGTSLAIDFSFDPLETDHVVFVVSNPVTPAKEWIMLTEITLTYSAVPEPSTYGMILGGLVLAGAALLRRRKA